MSAVKLPAAAEREAALDLLDLADGAPEPMLEALGEAARRITGFAAAAIVLIDGRRQWVRASVGDGDAWRELCRSGRSLPFCSETLAEPERLVVADARSELRSAAHPMVAGRPFIRAFAAVPLRLGPGLPVGMLCCLDQEARRPAAAELDALQAIGRAVEQDFARRQERLALVQGKARQSQRFARILESMPDALMVLDGKGYLAGSNNALFELAGVTRWGVGHPSEAGRYLLQRLVEVGAFGEERLEQILKRIESRQRFHGRQCLANGRWIDVTIEPVSGGGAILFCRDVDEDVRQLELARDAAIAADRAKSNFLATMSHEIRSPLNGVVGMLDLLSETRLDEEQRHFVEVAGRSSDHLLSVINDILDFAKLEAGRLDLESVDFDLVDLVERTIELLSAPAQEKGLELVADFGEGLTTALRGDPTRLSQVLLNLVSNAVKFSEKGEVLISVAAGATRHAVRLTVLDQGMGMTEEMLQRLFRPFSQVGSSINRRYGGTGLGLAICHDLVKLMGGRIGARSTLGKGSSFWFEIPLAPAERRPAPAAAASSPFAGQRCLVVDDRASSARRLKRQFEDLGLQCDSIAEPAAAQRAVRRAAEQGRPYALICLDEVMPQLGGVDLAARLHELPGLERARLVLCTASGAALSEEERALFDGVVPKPIRTQRLREILQRLGEPTSAEDLAPPAARAPFAPAEGLLAEHEVLLVEDNAVNREIASRVLRRAGIPLAIAEGGFSALEQAQRKRFSLVLMDIEMPDLDGMQTMHRLRALPGWDRRTPILALTAHAMADTRQRLLEAGFDDYLAKPFHGWVLTELVTSWLARRAAAGTRAPSPPVVAEPPTPLPPAGEERPDLDLAVLDELVKLDPEGVRELLRLFAEEGRARLVALKAAVESGDLSATAGMAHALAGGAASLGAAKLAAVAQAVEREARAGTLKGAAALDELERLFDPSVGALRRQLSPQPLRAA